MNSERLPLFDNNTALFGVVVMLLGVAAGGVVWAVPLVREIGFAIGVVKVGFVAAIAIFGVSASIAANRLKQRFSPIQILSNRRRLSGAYVYVFAGILITAAIAVSAVLAAIDFEGWPLLAFLIPLYAGPAAVVLALNFFIAMHILTHVANSSTGTGEA